MNKAKSNLLNIEKELDENLLLGLKSFSDDLIKFTNNENIIELRMRIATGKAAEKGRVLKARALTIIKNLTPIVIYKVRSGYKKLETFVTIHIKRLGIVIRQETITTELSDFLAESEKSIKDKVVSMRFLVWIFYSRLISLKVAM